MTEKLTILLAEDEENDIFMMRRAVKKMNNPVFLQATKDGEEAIEYLSGKNQYADRTLYPLPSLIILDIKMPRKNGFDVMEWIKADGSFIHVPIVVISSSKVQNDVEKAHRLGAREYLVKPVGFEQLQRFFGSTEDLRTFHRTTAIQIFGTKRD